MKMIIEISQLSFPNPNAPLYLQTYSCSKLLHQLPILAHALSLSENTASPRYLTRYMMAGEIQEPFNLSLLENSVHSGSVSFGRFEKETLSWEKRSSFSHNRYLEEAEKFTKPGSVTEMRAHFEAHFKKRGIPSPSPVVAQTWGQVVHPQPCTDKDDNLWESTSHCSRYSNDQERSQYGNSCVSYDDEYTSLSVALEKPVIGYSEATLEDKETISSSAAKSNPLKTVQKAISYAAATKAERVVRAKRTPSCNTKTIIHTKREKESKPKRIVKSIASKAPTSKKTDSLTPLATNTYRSKNCIDSATREKRTTTTNGFSFRSNERAEKRKEEKVEAKAKPMPKSTQARPRHASVGQAKARDDCQGKSSKTSCGRSVANGTAAIKSKLGVNKQKADIQRSLTGLRPKSSDHTKRNNANIRSLAVRT